MSLEKTRRRHRERIAERRAKVEENLGFLNRSTERELSLMPRGREWFLPMVAFSVGVALGGFGAPKRRLDPVGPASSGTDDAESGELAARAFEDESPESESSPSEKAEDDPGSDAKRPLLF